jgi:4'-phosphopantetheinyl transferase EntD
MIPAAATARPAAIAALLRGVFPAHVAVAAVGIAGEHPPLWPNEASLLARATPRRRAEFSAGRAAARQAMQMLGLPEHAVPSAPDRAPVWPATLVGSIAHDRQIAVAALARSADCISLGVDLEPALPLDPELVETVCSLTERARLTGSEKNVLARLIFSAKEAVYKAQYPLTRLILDFGRLEVALQPTEGAFSARFTAPTGKFGPGAVVKGRFARDQEHLVTGVAIMQSA